MSISISKRLLIVPFIIATLVSRAYAGDPPPTPEPLPSDEPPITLNFVGSGSATFKEEYTQSRGGQCGIETATAEESVSSINWSAKWKKVKPLNKQYLTANVSSFSGNSKRTDTSSCGGFSFLCESQLSLLEGYYPELRIKKSGKNYIVTIDAEAGLRGNNATGSTCIQSSVFDNAITEYMNSNDITALRLKLTPSDKNVRKKIKFQMKKTYDCKDPAKELSFLSTNCTITTDLLGTLTVNGKWSAKLLK